jgi:hypothetical protein
MHGLNEQRPEWGFGFQVEFLRIAAVRFGRRIDDRDRTPVNTWGVALGVPAGRFQARVEYAQIKFGSEYYRGNRDEFGLMLAWLFDQPE